MTSARSRILDAIQSASDRPPSDAAVIAAEARDLVAQPDLARPQLDRDDAVAHFVARLRSDKVKASMENIDTLDELPRAVARYLHETGLAPSIALQPEPRLLALDWTGFSVHTAMAADEPVGVVLARWGIAETGTMVFHSGRHAPVLFNFLPLHFILVVAMSAILPHLEDYLGAVAEAGEAVPRNVNFITGASGTTDIEGTLVHGAHGPGYLHIVLVGKADAP
jgi:L-lactate dehydrogenase complex protein LldG